MSDETTAGTSGPEPGPEVVSDFAAAEDAARDEALAQARGAATSGAHDAHAAAVADHDADAGVGGDVEGLPHAQDNHAADDAHGGHGGRALGPIDWRAYGAGIVGAALGLAVAAVLAVTTGYIVL